MIGLPTETNEDLDGIADLAYKVLNLGDEIRKDNGARGPQPKATDVAGFVPKVYSFPVGTSG